MFDLQSIFRLLNSYPQNLNLNLEECQLKQWSIFNQFLEFWTPIHKIWIWTWKRVNLNFQSIFKRGTLLGNEEPPNELNWIWTWKKVKTTYEFLKCATLIHNFKIKFMALELPQKSKGLDHLAMTKRNNSKSLNFMWLCRLCRFRSKKA